jgi:KDO2-lipid IV(A) lauroyltransferase
MQFLAFWLIYPSLWLISKLPFKLLYLFSDWVYLWLYIIFGYRKKVVRYNLKIALPNSSEAERKRVEKQFYHHLCDTFVEMIKSISLTKEELKKRYTFTNVEVMQNYENEGRTTMLVMGHYASHEWVFALQLYLKNPGHAIYKKIRNPYFDKMAGQIRGKWNTNLVTNKQSARKVAQMIEDKQTTVFGFAADQTPRLPKAHYWPMFLGHEIPFFTGVERMAKTYDCPVVHLSVRKVKRGFYSGTYHVLADTPKEYADFDITAAFAKALETQILEEPQYYLWTHKRFKWLGRKADSPAGKKTP